MKHTFNSAISGGLFEKRRQQIDLSCGIHIKQLEEDDCQVSGHSRYGTDTSPIEALTATHRASARQVSSVHRNLISSAGVAGAQLAWIIEELFVHDATVFPALNCDLVHRHSTAVEPFESEAPHNGNVFPVNHRIAENLARDANHLGENRFFMADKKVPSLARRLLIFLH